MGRSVLHVDANCFYASVEMQHRPELRDKPVVVCGDQEARHGIVLTANYLAKIWREDRHGDLASEREVPEPCCAAARLPRIHPFQPHGAGDLRGLHRSSGAIRP